MSVAIRPLRTDAEFAACVALQEATWGAGFSERVPTALLKVAQRIGGLASGAFAPDGRLLGFVFGLTGIEHGRLVHWSDMLAVLPEARDRGIGRQLKEYQREAMRALGVERIYWTYDPLVARNAYLNLVRLGARPVEYVRDMYGAETDSVLHRGVGTDRFVVAWDIGPGARALPPIDPDTESATPIVTLGDTVPPGASRYCVEIPPDIHAVQERSLEEAAAWRATTRRALTEALASDRAVVGFYRNPADGRAYYVVERAAPPATGDRS